MTLKDLLIASGGEWLALIGADTNCMLNIGAWARTAQFLPRQ